MLFLTQIICESVRIWFALIILQSVLELRFKVIMKFFATLVFTLLLVYSVLVQPHSSDEDLNIGGIKHRQPFGGRKNFGEKVSGTGTKSGTAIESLNICSLIKLLGFVFRFVFIILDLIFSLIGGIIGMNFLMTFMRFLFICMLNFDRMLWQMWMWIRYFWFNSIFIFFLV